jgi:hypothetical protein
MKSIFYFLPLLVFSLVNGQAKESHIIRKGDLPEGTYFTIEDILNKTPTSTDALYFKVAMPGDTTDVPDKVFFFDKKTNKKVKWPLAVSYKGELYLQTYNKYTHKEDKGYDPDAASRFCIVSNYGRFVYFEENMRGKWSKAFLGGLTPATILIKGKRREWCLI